jgi:hypothetical protein
MTPSPVVDYDIIYNTFANQCPLSTCNKKGTGVQEICLQNISYGANIIGVNKSSGSGTYNLTMTCQDYCNQCPWPDPGCNMTGGQNVSGLNMANGQFQYFYYNITSPKNVTITKTQSSIFVYFYLYTNWTSNQCPLTRCTAAAGGQPESCSFNLLPGTYIAGVRRANTATGTYSLNLSYSKVTEGGPCYSGNDCQSGYCIEGYCRAACNNTFVYQRCSNDNLAYDIGCNNGPCKLCWNASFSTIDCRPAINASSPGSNFYAVDTGNNLSNNSWADYSDQITINQTRQTKTGSLTGVKSYYLYTNSTGSNSNISGTFDYSTASQIYSSNFFPNLGYTYYYFWGGAVEPCCYNFTTTGVSAYLDSMKLFLNFDDLSLSTPSLSSPNSKVLRATFNVNHNNTGATTNVNYKCKLNGDPKVSLDCSSNNVAPGVGKTCDINNPSCSGGSSNYVKCYANDSSYTYIDTDTSIQSATFNPDDDLKYCQACNGTGNWNSTIIGWEPLTQASCCGDDAGEYNRTEVYGTGMHGSSQNTKACCDASTDCVNASKCYSSGSSPGDIDGNGDSDYCLSGNWVDCNDNSQCQSGWTCQSNDCVFLNYLIIQSINISYWNLTQWIEAKPDVTPLEGNNRTMNVTVNVQNSTTISSCNVRVLNATGSYFNPTIGPLTGTIRSTGSQIQCNCSWGMEFWRNPGQWNVSVNITLSTGLSNFTSKNFTYVKLPSAIMNTSYVNFTGSPGATVNSTTAFPLSINNSGNVRVNVTINGTDLKGETYPSYVINVGNITYNETTTGIFRNLTYSSYKIFSFLNPTDKKSIYFKCSIPLGFISQNYNNIINITGVEA